MTNSGTTPSNINSDPTKWRDRIAEFKIGAVSGARAVGAVVVGGAVVFGGVAGLAAAAVIAVGGAVTSIGFFAVAFAAGFAGLASGGAAAAIGFGFAAFAAVNSICSADPAPDPFHPRPVARKLGLVFPSLTALAAGYTLETVSQPPAAPVPAAPEIMFNATAQECKYGHIKATIDKAMANGFSVKCVKPSL